MNCIEIRELLNDHVDGTLDPVARESVFQHLRQCRECTLEQESIRVLVAESAEMPKSVMPGRDLWPGIARRIAEGPGDVETAAEAEPEIIRFRLRHRRPLTTRLGVAASFLVVIAFGAVLLVQQWRGQVDAPGQVAGMAATEGTGAAATASGGQESTQGSLAADRATRPDVVLESNGGGPELALVRRLLEQQMGASSSETLAVLKESFREMDQAAARAREALKENPENRKLALMLASIYRNKMQILERTVRLSV